MVVHHAVETGISIERGNKVKNEIPLGFAMSFEIRDDSKNCFLNQSV